MAEPKEVESTATVSSDDDMDAETFVAAFYADLESRGANAVCRASGESKSNLKVYTYLHIQSAVRSSQPAVTSPAVDHEATEANVVCIASGASKSNLELYTNVYIQGADDAESVPLESKESEDIDLVLNPSALNMIGGGAAAQVSAGLLQGGGAVSESAQFPGPLAVSGGAAVSSTSEITARRVARESVNRLDLRSAQRARNGDDLKQNAVDRELDSVPAAVFEAILGPNGSRHLMQRTQRAYARYNPLGALAPRSGTAVSPSPRGLRYSRHQQRQADRAGDDGVNSDGSEAQSAAESGGAGIAAAVSVIDVTPQLLSGAQEVGSVRGNVGGFRGSVSDGKMSESVADCAVSGGDSKMAESALSPDGNLSEDSDISTPWRLVEFEGEMKSRMAPFVAARSMMATSRGQSDRNLMRIMRREKYVGGKWVLFQKMEPRVRGTVAEERALLELRAVPGERTLNDQPVLKGAQFLSLAMKLLLSINVNPHGHVVAHPRYHINDQDYGEGPYTFGALPNAMQFEILFNSGMLDGLMNVSLGFRCYAVARILFGLVASNVSLLEAAYRSVMASAWRSAGAEGVDAADAFFADFISGRTFAADYNGRIPVDGIDQYEGIFGAKSDPDYTFFVVMSQRRGCNMVYQLGVTKPDGYAELCGMANAESAVQCVLCTGIDTVEFTMGTETLPRGVGALINTVEDYLEYEAKSGHTAVHWVIEPGHYNITHSPNVPPDQMPRSYWGPFTARELREGVPSGMSRRDLRWRLYRLPHPSFLLCDEEEVPQYEPTNYRRDHDGEILTRWHQGVCIPLPGLEVHLIRRDVFRRQWAQHNRRCGPLDKYQHHWKVASGGGVNVVSSDSQKWQDLMENDKRGGTLGPNGDGDPWCNFFDVVEQRRPQFKVIGVRPEVGAEARSRKEAITEKHAVYRQQSEWLELSSVPQYDAQKDWKYLRIEHQRKVRVPARDCFRKIRPHFERTEKGDYGIDVSLGRSLCVGLTSPRVTMECAPPRQLMMPAEIGGIPLRTVTSSKGAQLTGSIVSGRQRELTYLNLVNVELNGHLFVKGPHILLMRGSTAFSVTQRTGPPNSLIAFSALYVAKWRMGSIPSSNDHYPHIPQSTQGHVCPCPSEVVGRGFLKCNCAKLCRAPCTCTLCGLPRICRCSDRGDGAVVKDQAEKPEIVGLGKTGQRTHCNRCKLRLSLAVPAMHLAVETVNCRLGGTGVVGPVNVSVPLSYFGGNDPPLVKCGNMLLHKEDAALIIPRDGCTVRMENTVVQHVFDGVRISDVDQGAVFRTDASFGFNIRSDLLDYPRSYRSPVLAMVNAYRPADSPPSIGRFVNVHFRKIVRAAFVESVEHEGDPCVVATEGSFVISETDGDGADIVMLSGQGNLPSKPHKRCRRSPYSPFLFRSLLETESRVFRGGRGRICVQAVPLGDGTQAHNYVAFLPLTNGWCPSVQRTVTADVRDPRRRRPYVDLSPVMALRDADGELMWAVPMRRFKPNALQREWSEYITMRRLQAKRSVPFEPYRVDCEVNSANGQMFAVHNTTVGPILHLWSTGNMTIAVAIGARRCFPMRPRDKRKMRRNNGDEREYVALLLNGLFRSQSSGAEGSEFEEELQFVQQVVGSRALVMEEKKDSAVKIPCQCVCCQGICHRVGDCPHPESNHVYGFPDATCGCVCCQGICHRVGDCPHPEGGHVYGPEVEESSPESSCRCDCCMGNCDCPDGGDCPHPDSGHVSGGDVEGMDEDEDEDSDLDEEEEGGGSNAVKVADEDGDTICELD